MGTKKNPGKFDCYKAAKPNEPIFTLRATDPLAPLLIRLWAGFRQMQIAFVMGKERMRKLAKIQEALDVAQAMDLWRHDKEKAKAKKVAK